MVTHARPRTLHGIGMGPGDPDLVTLKALKVLRSADVILVPETERRADGPGRAEEIITALVPDATERIHRVPFSMSRALDERQETRSSAADVAVAAFTAGAQHVALASIGDPNVFSTFIYVAQRVRERMGDVHVELVPGITAMQALAAAADEPLVTGEEVLALVPATAGMERLDAVLGVADTVVVYKGGRRITEVVSHLGAAGRDVVVGTDLGLPGQVLRRGDDLADLESLGYFSTALATPTNRTEEW